MDAYLEVGAGALNVDPADGSQVEALDYHGPYFEIFADKLRHLFRGEPAGLPVLDVAEP